MPSLSSGSGHGGGSYESYTRGPAGGQTTMRGRGRGGGGGFDPQSMAEAMLAEAQASARSKRTMAEQRHSEWMKEQKKKRAPKMASARKAPPMDPMRYANQQRQAARNAQFAKGGMGSYGQGELAMEHKGEQAYQSAMAAYPAYLAMMQG